MEEINKEVEHRVIIQQKKCSCCEQVLPITMFNKHGRSKDGYESICVQCKQNAKGCNPKLVSFTPRDLMEELKARGYSGKLVYTQVKEIIL